MFRITDTDLRLLEFNDLEQVLLWRNSERIRNSMFTSRLIGWEEHVAWFNQLQHRKDQAVLLFSYQGVSMGVINYIKINRLKYNCEWGFYIGPEDAAPGSGTAMGLLGLDYAFKNLAMNTIRGQCFTINTASIRYHLKLGFVLQKKMTLQADNHATNSLVYFFELTKETWEEKRASLYPHIFADYEKVAVGEKK